MPRTNQPGPNPPPRKKRKNSYYAHPTTHRPQVTSLCWYCARSTDSTANADPHPSHDNTPEPHVCKWALPSDHPDHGPVPGWVATADPVWAMYPRGTFIPSYLVHLCPLFLQDKEPLPSYFPRVPTPAATNYLTTAPAALTTLKGVNFNEFRTE